MSQTPFDTLEHVKKLEALGIENAEGHTRILLKILTGSYYSKHEVQNMLDATMINVEHRLDTMDRRIDKIEIRMDNIENTLRQCVSKSQLEESVAKLYTDMQKAFNKYFIATTSVLGSLIVLFGSISTAFHFMGN